MDRSWRWTHRLAAATALAVLATIVAGVSSNLAGADTEIVVTQEPLDLVTAVGTVATFTAAASSDPAPAVQWERSNDGGTTFSPVPGATGPSYSFTAAAGDTNGPRIRAVFTNSLGSVTTRAALLDAGYLPTITTQPTSRNVPVDAPTTMTAEGANYDSWRWEVSTNGGTRWGNLSGVGTGSPISVTFNVTISYSQGWVERVVLSNKYGTTASAQARATPTFTPVIYSQPVGGPPVAVGQTASFTVVWYGGGSAQWQSCTFGAFGSLLCSNIPGATGGTYTRTIALSDVTTRFRAVISNGSTTINSNLVTVDVQHAPYFPGNTGTLPNRTVNPGGTAQFSLAPQANPAATLQWERSAANSSTWEPVPGATSQTLNIAAPPVTLDGSRYRLVATNSLGSVTSSPGTLTVNGVPVVTTEPVAQNVSVGDVATFTAATIGHPIPTVNWQISSDGTTWTPISGATSTTYQRTATVADHGSWIRAVFTNSYGSATTSTAKLTTLRTQTVALAALPNGLVVGVSFTPTASASSLLPVTIIASGSCSSNGTTVTVIAGGACYVTATQPGSTVWAPATSVTRPTVTRTPQTITFPPLPPAPAVGSTTVLTATSSAGTAVSYVAVGACSVSGTVLRYLSAGTECSVEARQAGGPTTLPASPVTRTAIPVPGTQVITLQPLPATLTIGDAVAVAASATSGLPVELATTGPCSINNAILSISGVGVGLCTITATQAGNEHWRSANAVTRSIIARGSQAITFADLPTSPAVGSSLQLAATSSSGLPVRYVASGGCTVTTSTLRFVTTAVACTVTASQPGNTFYLPAAPATRSTQAIRASQTIIFGTPTAGVSIGDSFVLSVRATSGLPVSLASSGPCALVGTTVTMTGSGTCVMIASQDGNADWLAANSISRQVIIRATQQLTVGDLPTSPPVGGTYRLAATSTSGLSVTFRASGGCTVAGSIVTWLSAGVVCEITASQAGNPYFLPAAPMTISTTPVPGPQTITLATPPSGLVVGATFGVTASATSKLPVQLSATGPCTLAGITVTVTGVGTCIVTAAQGGDANWLPATPLSRSTVVKSPPS